MKRFFLAAATAATLTTGAVAPAAADGFGSVEECVSAVINWCLETFPDHDCSQASGVSECLELFETAADGAQGILQTRPNDPVARLMLLVNPPQRPESRADGEDECRSDDSTGRYTGRDTGRDTGR